MARRPRGARARQGAAPRPDPVLRGRPGQLRRDPRHPEPGPRAGPGPGDARRRRRRPRRAICSRTPRSARTSGRWRSTTPSLMVPASGDGDGRGEAAGQPHRVRDPGQGGLRERAVRRRDRRDRGAAAGRGPARAAAVRPARATASRPPQSPGWSRASGGRREGSQNRRGGPHRSAGRRTGVHARSGPREPAGVAGLGPHAPNRRGRRARVRRVTVGSARSGPATARSDAFEVAAALRDDRRRGTSGC